VAVTAVILSAIAALFSSICTFVLMAIIGATCFRGEAGYGFSLMFGPIAALVAGILTFITVFRWIRSH
jgi:hypothetical protein